MSDEHEFAMLAKSLGEGDFARSVFRAEKMRRYTSMVLAGLGLLASLCYWRSRTRYRS